MCEGASLCVMTTTRQLGTIICDAADGIETGVTNQHDIALTFEKKSLLLLSCGDSIQAMLIISPIIVISRVE